MNPLSDPIALALGVSFGVAVGWILIEWLRRTPNLRCKIGLHNPSERFEPAIGGRDVMRCTRCNDIIYEVQRTKGSLRRH